MNRDNRQSKDAQRLEIAMQAMRFVDAPAIPETLIRSTRMAMEQSCRQRKWRVHVLRGAAAAIVALVLLVIVVMRPPTSSSLALADVVRQVERTTTLRAVVVDPHDAGTLYASGPRFRWENPGGGYVIGDTSTGEQVSFDPKSKSAYRGPKSKGVGLDFYGIFRELATAVSNPIEDYIDGAGRRYPGLSGKAALKFAADKTWKVDVEVWCDPKTKLPVRLQFGPRADGGKRMLFEQIEFDVPVDNVSFDMTIPADYTVYGLSPDQLQPAPSKKEAAKLTIVPGVGIGEVKFGMSREQIIAVLGAPDFTMHGTYLTFASKGLQLVLVGREPDKLGMIIANPMDAASLTRNEFPGQTDKGIRIGSSFQEVRKAYGAPDPPMPGQPKHPSAFGAGYQALGLGFQIVDGKVKQIFVDRMD